jgi:hypothetical protein
MNDDALKTVKEMLRSLDSGRHLSLREAALKLDCSVDYLRRHLIEFPGSWKMPGGGEIRIPVRDLEAMIKKRKINRAVAPLESVPG